MVRWFKYSVSKELQRDGKPFMKKLDVCDAHAHVGVDMDGQKLSAVDLLNRMDDAGISKSVIFPLNEPKDPDFHKANNRILIAAQHNKGSFVPFFRINPKKPWKREFELRVEQEFAGIKVHPRSQNFSLRSKSFLELCKSAQKAYLPMLIHLGFGVKNIVEQFYDLVTDFPELNIIVGHSGFADLERIIDGISVYDNVLFETSTLRVFDIYTLLERVSYKKIAFGSDIPYYDIDISILSLLDTAMLMGKTEKELKAIFGGNIRSWVE